MTRPFPFPRRLLLAGLLALAAPAGASAAQLVLANGDRLTGTVIKRADGKVYFHSDVLGDLVAPENVVTIVDSPPLPHAPSNSLAGLPPKVSPAPKASVPVLVATPTLGFWPWLERRPLLILKPVVTDWTGKVEFGYGNELTAVRTVTTAFRADAERNVGPDDILFKGRYLYGSSNGAPTTDQDEVDFQWRHNLNARFFTQAITSYSSDKVALINTNLEQTADIGYKMFASLRATVDVGGGVVAQYFDATGIQGGADYLGNAFQDYSYKINGRYTFTENATVQYSPQDRGRFGVLPNVQTPISGNARNYDYQFHATLQGKITDQLSLNLHFDYEYNNVILDPASRADQRITTTVGYGF